MLRINEAFLEIYMKILVSLNSVRCWYWPEYLMINPQDDSNWDLKEVKSVLNSKIHLNLHSSLSNSTLNSEPEIVFSYKLFSKWLQNLSFSACNFSTRRSRGKMDVLISGRSVRSKFQNRSDYTFWTCHKLHKKRNRWIPGSRILFWKFCKPAWEFKIKLRLSSATFSS